jgi:hypothetical protein
MGRNDQQLIKSEVSHDGPHHFDMSVVHGIEGPSVCSYATFAHRSWFLVPGLWFSGSGLRLVSRTRNQILQTRSCRLPCPPNLLDSCADSHNKVIYAVAAHGRNLKHLESLSLAMLAKPLYSRCVIQRVHL